MIGPTSAVRYEIEALLRTTLHTIEGIATEYLTYVAYTWQQRCPRRTVEFMDAMGQAGFLIDDKWVEVPEFLTGRQVWRGCAPWGQVYQPYEEIYTSGEQAKHALLAPLLNAMEWYADVLDDNCISNLVGVNFKLEPQAMRP